jgi:hypothetical protein
MMKRRATAIACACVALVAAATATAAIQVYSNNFSSRAEFKQVKADGKGCKKDWLKDKDRIEVQAKGGPSRCKLKLPVQGDAAQPDHELIATAKIGKSTPKKVRGDVYIAVSVREGKSSRYELRIFPHRQRYELRREPNENPFPERGSDNGIGRIGERNDLRIEATGNTIRARVNNHRIGPVNDSAARDQRGTRMSLTFGVEGRTGKDLDAWFDDVVVRVPNP